MVRRCRRAISSIVKVRPRDRLQIRHHQSGWNSLAADVGAKDPNAFLTQVEEVVQIAPNLARFQCSAGYGGPTQHWHYAREQMFLNDASNLKFALQPQLCGLLLLQPIESNRHFIEATDQLTHLILASHRRPPGEVAAGYLPRRTAEVVNSRSDIGAEPDAHPHARCVQEQHRE